VLQHAHGCTWAPQYRFNTAQASTVAFFGLTLYYTITCVHVSRHAGVQSHARLKEADLIHRY
jgi:uncharacterized membrane protein YqjE